MPISQINGLTWVRDGKGETPSWLFRALLRSGGATVCPGAGVDFPAGLVGVTVVTGEGDGVMPIVGVGDGVGDPGVGVAGLEAGVC